MKHFMGYGIPEAGHDRANTRISDFELLNVHLPPFLAAVTHGNVRSVMESYNSVSTYSYILVYSCTHMYAFIFTPQHIL